MAASYPGAVKNFTAVVNGVTKLVAALFNSPYDEVTAIETELGTDPAGSMPDVKTRLAVSLNNDGTLKCYDSGWFAIADNTDYTKTHSLGTTKVITQVMLATSDAGADANTIPEQEHGISRGVATFDLTTTEIKLHTFNITAGNAQLWDGAALVVATHARIIMLALG